MEKISVQNEHDGELGECKRKFCNAIKQRKSIDGIV